jgi:Straboviridae polynucleotide kinase
LEAYNSQKDALKTFDDFFRLIKEELKRQGIQEYDLAQILCVFDDRQKVVDMWRSLGQACFQVAPGDF